MNKCCYIFIFILHSQTYVYTHPGDNVIPRELIYFPPHKHTNVISPHFRSHIISKSKKQPNLSIYTKRRGKKTHTPRAAAQNQFPASTLVFQLHPPPNIHTQKGEKKKRTNARKVGTQASRSRSAVTFGGSACSPSLPSGFATHIRAGGCRVVA